MSEQKDVLAQQPSGWKLVPLKPTEEMIEAGRDNNATQWNEGTDRGFPSDVANDVYVSMVRAAPEHLTPAGVEAVRAAYTKEAAERDIEIAQLRGTIDLLERNDRIQAKLLADTARERDLAVSQVESARWQLIETAPRDGRRILATGGGLEDTVEVASYNERVGAWNTENYTLDDRDDEAEGYNRPTHWKPMPLGLSIPSTGGQPK